MKVQFSFVGFLMSDDSQPSDIIVDLPHVPQVEEIVYVPRVGEMYVRTIVWFLTHDDNDEEIDEPFVYVVVGPNREQSVPSHLQRYLSGNPNKR